VLQTERGRLPGGYRTDPDRDDGHGAAERDDRKVTDREIIEKSDNISYRTVQRHGKILTAPLSFSVSQERGVGVIMREKLTRSDVEKIRAEIEHRKLVERKELIEAVKE